MFKANPLKAFLFLLPNLSGFLLFTLGPMCGALGLSFFAWDMFGPARFVGLSNYRELLGLELPPGDLWNSLLLLSGGGVSLLFAAFIPNRNVSKLFVAFASIMGGFAVFFCVRNAVAWTPKFWQSLWNSLFLMLGLPLGMAGSLLLAVMLNEKVFGNKFFRLIYFLPSIVGGVGVYLLWKWIFSPDYGPVNYLISSLFGVPGPVWFESSAWAKPALIIMGFWSSVGGTNMILYLAALQSVDPGLVEAAKIDGAGAVRRFFAITVPMVSSTSMFIMIMGVIQGFQGGFDSAYVITRGGPAGATTTVNYFIYETGFENFQFGTASAASMLLFFLILAMSWVNWKYGSRHVHYA